MVKNRGIDDYEKYKQEIRDYYIERFPKKIKYIDNFMEYFGKLYDKHKKSFIPYKVAWYLYSRKLWTIKNNQHYWIAFIGKKGGEGKSTLAKNFLFFLDPTFTTEKRLAMNYEDFVKIAYNTKKIKKIANPSILFDEMDIKTHVLSKEGRSVRTIVTKARQLGLFVAVCANTLSDIPSFLYDRITTIVFLERNHYWWLWDREKDKKGTIIDDIKKGFKKEYHNVFKWRTILRKAHFKNMYSTKYIPFEEGDYLNRKQEDLFADIEKYMGIKAPKAENKIDKEAVVKLLKKNNPELTYPAIAKGLNLSRRWTIELAMRGTRGDGG